MFDQKELNRIWAKTDEDILTELLNKPDNFIADKLYLIDYHFSTDLKQSMRDSLTELKTYIETNPDGYIAENILLLAINQSEI
jgi:hypothetical protein